MPRENCAIPRNSKHDSLPILSLRVSRDMKSIAVVPLRKGAALHYASPDLQSDHEIVMVAVLMDGGALEDASEELRSSHEIVMAAVSKNGNALEHASEELQSDHKIVLAAVSQCGYALQFASKELRSDHRIVMAAVSQSWEALEHASEDLRSDPEVLARTNFWSVPVAAVLRVALVSGRSYTHVVIVRNTHPFYKGVPVRYVSEIEDVLYACAVHLGLDETLVAQSGTLIAPDGTTLDSLFLHDLQPGALHEATLVIDP